MTSKRIMPVLFAILAFPLVSLAARGLDIRIMPADSVIFTRPIPLAAIMTP